MQDANFREIEKPKPLIFIPLVMINCYKMMMMIIIMIVMIMLMMMRMKANGEMRSVEQILRKK